MAPSIPRPTGPEGSPSEPPPRRDPTDLGPKPEAADEGAMRARIGTSRWPVDPRADRPAPPGAHRPALAADLPAVRGRQAGDTDPRDRGCPRPGVCVRPRWRPIATIQWGGHVALRDTAGGPGAPLFLDHGGHARGLAFSPDGRSLAVGGDEPDILLYDVKAGGAGHPLGMPIRWVKGLGFSPDGRLLAASSHLDHEILLRDLAAGRQCARLRGHEPPVISLAFAPDGRSLASGGLSDEAIVLWDLATGRPRRLLGVPPGPVICLSYSPDGHWLASTSRTRDRSGCGAWRASPRPG